MFEIKKTFEIAIAHRLALSYDSKCNRLHGHNLLISVYCRGELAVNGIVVDFTKIKNLVSDELDHRDLNKIEGLGFDFIKGVNPQQKIFLNPTAERLAYWICQRIKKCYRVDVQESEGNIATYFDDTPQFVPMPP